MNAYGGLSKGCITTPDAQYCAPITAEDMAAIGSSLAKGDAVLLNLIIVVDDILGDV